MAVLTINHYLNQANSFITDIRNNRNAYYMFAARSQPWSNSSGGNDESAIVTPNNSLNQTEQNLYSDILFGKLLKDADVTNLIPRYDWTANTVYAAYDQNDANLYDKQFFVVTDRFEVYKCLDNNNNANSFVKPSLTSISGTFKTGDGYVWKYMFTIDSFSNSKFTTTNYIPVTPNSEVRFNAAPGSIDVIKVTNGGNGYFVYETGYIEKLVNRYTIQLPEISSNINDYYSNSSIYLKSGFGAGQVREISSSNGTSKQIAVAEPFDTYARLDLTNVNGTVTSGYYVEQQYDDVNYIYTQGYYNQNSIVAQSDTGATGRVYAANSSILQISRTSNTQFSLGIPIIDISQSGVLEPGTVAVGNVGACNTAFVVTPGTGYTANAVVTVTPTGGSGSGAVINATATAGKITATNVQTPGTGYFTAPLLTVDAPVAQTFNANTAVTGGSGSGSNNIITLASAGAFVSNDLITYTVSAGNTAIGGLSSGTSYYIEFANATVVALKPTLTGSRIALSKGPTETGHTLQGVTATAVVFCDNQIVRGTSTQLNDSANGYANGEYIRIGANTSSNIRRVANNINATALIVASPFSTTFTASANLHFKMPVASEPSSIVLYGANGYISNTNLSSIQLAITNSALSGVFFTVGEKVNMTNSTGINQGANGVIAFANTTTTILSSVSGTWLANSGGTQFFVKGESSLQLSQIVSTASNPNITIQDPTGTFKLGYPVNFKTTVSGSVSGNATIVAKFDLPNDQTEYVIAPTVRITGDGSNAAAIAEVNNSNNSTYSVIGVDIINPGFGYTSANVSIYANTNYGSNATAKAVISPVFGHGYDPLSELGSRYVGVDSIFDTVYSGDTEFPGYGSYRKVGILQNPQFRDLKVTVTDFDRINLGLTGYTTTLGWTPGEVVVQQTTNAAGVVVFGNSTFLQLKNAKGNFVSSNTIYGYNSNTTANVTTTSVIYFTVGNSAQIISQTNSGATGIITNVVNNTVYFVSNVVGQFADGDVMFDATTNAYATVDSIFIDNGEKDVSANFGNKFNQTARITLTSNTGSFANNEYVIQEISLASGRVVCDKNDLDLSVSSMSGTFSAGQLVTDMTTNANGFCIFANTTYIKLTAVSQNLTFTSGSTINNGLSSNAVISNTFPVLVLNDISDATNFQSGSNTIVGQTSGSLGFCNNASLIKYPELIRDTGKLIYSENFAPVTRTTDSREEFKLVIKF